MNEVTKKLDRMPPWMCRMAARTGHGKGQRPMTNREIAKRAGLALSTIVKISWMHTWASVPASTIDAFAYGCGVNILRMKGHRKFFKGKQAYLNNASPSQRKLFDRLLNHFVGSPMTRGQRDASAQPPACQE